MKLRLSSRQSALAQAQAFQVGNELEKLNEGLKVDYHFRESLGDKNLTDPLWKMPEKGVFTEDFLMDLTEKKTDLVVHSWKDLPTEVKAQTEIVATLPRADQRDLLLFKKTSREKKSFKVFSSSPRRMHNLESFLLDVLPSRPSAIEFQSVRGNIPTRIKKLLEDSEIDALVLAKAALDRLLTDQHFPETVSFLRKALTQCDWMVLPLSENPNAAAQGALAIEIHRENGEARNFLQNINCEKTFRCAQREREILKEFGGGCHLALGMSVLERSFGRIEIVKGLTPAGEKIYSRKFFPVKVKPAHLKWGRLEFLPKRKKLTVDQQKTDALWVSKFEAWENLDRNVLWCAGVSTWKKLAAQGVWVQGCAEGLGENEDPEVEILMGRKLKWTRLTHDQAPAGDKDNLSTYALELELISTDLGESDGFYWKSGSEFLTALKRFPELKNKQHSCGPGRSFETIKQSLGSEENLYVELGHEFITVI